MKQVDAVMAGRPDIEAKGKKRPSTLRDDLKELRNRFFHYGRVALDATSRSGDGDTTRRAISAEASASAGNPHYC
jgi:hypothetical protein